MLLWDGQQAHIFSNSIRVVGKFIHNYISSWLIDHVCGMLNVVGRREGSCQTIHLGYDFTTYYVPIHGKVCDQNVRQYPSFPQRWCRDYPRPLDRYHQLMVATGTAEKPPDLGLPRWCWGWSSWWPLWWWGHQWPWEKSFLRPWMTLEEFREVYYK